MDGEPDVLGDSGAIHAALPVNSATEEPDFSEKVLLTIANSDSIMDVVKGLTVAVHELYSSEDIEVRLCWWLVGILLILLLGICLAWKSYGQEIMTVLACQDKLTRSGSMSRESSRQSSAEEVPVVTEPPAASREQLCQSHEQHQPSSSSSHAPNHSASSMDTHQSHEPNQSSRDLSQSSSARDLESRSSLSASSSFQSGSSQPSLTSTSPHHPKTD